MKVVYIGHKEIKADNVAQTGITWTRGQIQDVADEKKAAKLLEHPLIWANADGKKAEEVTAMLLPELAVVAPEPRVNFLPQDPESPFWEPVVVVVPEDIFKKMQTQELVSVFMKPEDADAFGEWKLERDTRPSAPAKTGPRAQAKETKAGTDTKVGLEAAAKKVA